MSVCHPSASLVLVVDLIVTVDPRALRRLGRRLHRLLDLRGRRWLLDDRGLDRSRSFHDHRLTGRQGFLVDWLLRCRCLLDRCRSLVDRCGCRSDRGLEGRGLRLVLHRLRGFGRF